ncbi:nephrin-like [Lytechinus pictus]|uniref:nephrin-like n=1 Tax=Lytechinus pictus TaxID=7653 RepID=UPI0030B9BC8D
MPAPPSQVSIDSAQPDGPISNSATITVTSGEPYNITCNTFPARPPVVLTWLIPDDVIFYVHGQSDTIQGNKYVSRKTATITPSTNDQGKVLRCEASHPKLFTNLQSSVYLNVHVLPSSMTLFQKGIGKDKDLGSAVMYVQEDSPSSITCKCIGSFPAVEFVWMLGPPDSVEIASIGDANLEDGIETTVTCRARNGYPNFLIHWYIGLKNVTEDSSLKNTVNAADRYDAESSLIVIPNWLDHGKRLICEAVQTTTFSIMALNESIVLNISCKH